MTGLTRFIQMEGKLRNLANPLAESRLEGILKERETLKEDGHLEVVREGFEKKINKFGGIFHGGGGGKNP